MIKDSLGDRMKENYEDRQRYYLTRRTPVIVRVDGKAFHTFTRGLERPFDEKLSDAMIHAARCVAEEMQGFKLGYVQSDEASFLLTDYDTLQTDAWFDYNKSKIESISAAMMTAWFGITFEHPKGDKDLIAPAVFDARSFNVPREEVANYFLWRAKDWERNSLAMFCGAFFSHKEMHGKGRAEKHEMLHAIGKNWTANLDQRWRNGAWIYRADSGIEVRHDICPTFSEIEAVVSPLIEPLEESSVGA